MKPLTAERLRQVLDYDPSTGLFVRKDGLGSPYKASNKNGYVQIAIDGNKYYGHRLAWFWLNGDWPPHHIDHINGVRDDNRAVNLREATTTENQANRRPTIQLKGAYKHAQAERWFSTIRRDGETHYLGCYATAEEAHAAYVDAAKRLHGSFARIK